MKAKKSLGQHFLHSQGALEKIVHACEIKRGELVIEIGPGRGVLTYKLLEDGAHVIAIEKDKALARKLGETFRDKVKTDQLTIITEDILETNLFQLIRPQGNYKVIGNIPYYITGAIIRKFCSTSRQPSRAVFLIQKEVAERIVDKKGSLLSISIQVYGTPKIAGRVKAGSFTPPPKIDSAILIIEDVSHTFFKAIDEQRFFELLHCGFGQKRKQLAGNLKKFYSPETIGKIFNICGISKTARAEELTKNNWRCLGEHLVPLK